MLTTKKLLKSITNSSYEGISVIMDNTNNLINDANIQKDNEILQIFENGTVLGSVIPNENITTLLTTNSGSDNNNCTISNSQISVNNCMNNSCSMISASSISILFDVNNCCASLTNRNDNNCESTTVIDSNLEQTILNQTICNESQHPSNQMELLNSSVCSRESRQGKRVRRKSLKKSQEQQQHQQQQQQQQQDQHELYDNRFPPQYTAIFLDNNDGSGGATAIGSSAGIMNQVQQFESNGVRGSRMGLAVSAVHRTSNSNRRGLFGYSFSRPSLPFVIGILALGGVACTLGGIVLGSTGLVEHSTQYLSAALLMIGIGVSLLVISGAIWRLSIPDEIENNCPCFRQHIEACRNCNSPYCTNLIIPTGFMYPEFQHRTPPPSYLTSLNECTVGLLLNQEVSSLQRNESVIRLPTPPPAYRPTNP